MPSNSSILLSFLEVSWLNILKENCYFRYVSSDKSIFGASTLKRREILAGEGCVVTAKIKESSSLGLTSAPYGSYF